MMDETHDELAGAQANRFRMERGGRCGDVYDDDVGRILYYWGRSAQHRVQRASVRQRQRAALRRWRAKHG